VHAEGPAEARQARSDVLPERAQVPAYRLAQDVATEKILAAPAATRDGPGNPPGIP
jgi:hypothetical protein